MIERKVTGFLCGLSPWLLGLAPAYIAWSAMVALAWPVVLCYILAVSVELFGTMAASQALELRAYNKRKRQTDPTAPTGAAWAVACVYLAASALFCAMHAFPEIARYTLIIWAVMGGAAMGARAMRQDHLGTLAQIEQDKAERKAERAERKAERSAPVHEQPANVSDPFEMTPELERVVEFYREHPEASFRTAAQALERPLSSVHKDVERLETAHIIARNGQVKVLA